MEWERNKFALASSKCGTFRQSLHGAARREEARAEWKFEWSEDDYVLVPCHFDPEIFGVTRPKAGIGEQRGVRFPLLLRYQTNTTDSSAL